MINKQDLVKTKDTRPAGKPDECFYCGERLGTPHKKECVCLEKTVIVEAVFTIPYKTVRSWGKHEIEFHLNESSWCADSFIEELKAYSMKNGCLCDVAKFRLKRLK